MKNLLKLVKLRSVPLAQKEQQFLKSHSGHDFYNQKMQF